MMSKDKNGEATTAALRQDIDRTRGEMSKTVNEIEERLSPAHIKEQVASVTAGVTADLEQKVAELKQSVLSSYDETKGHVKDDLGRELRDARHKVSSEITNVKHAVREATVGRVEHMVHDARDTVTEAGSSILGTIKANPIPAALIGLGIGWMLFGSRSARNSGPSNVSRRLQNGVGHVADDVQHAVHDAGEGVSHFAQDAGHRVAEMAGGARDAVVHVASDAANAGGRLARGAGRGVMRAERTIESTFRDNPLALGAVAVAVGAAIGLALPHTKVEDAWMGESKETLVHKAGDLAGDAIHSLEDRVTAQLEAGDQKEQKPESRNGRSERGANL